MTTLQRSDQLGRAALFYISRVYATVWLTTIALMATLPILIGKAPNRAILVALIYSGVFSAPIVYWWFQQWNLWPLYDNLRISRLGILLFLSISSQVVTVIYVVSVW